MVDTAFVKPVYRFAPPGLIICIRVYVLTQDLNQLQFFSFHANIYSLMVGETGSFQRTLSKSTGYITECSFASSQLSVEQPVSPRPAEIMDILQYRRKRQLTCCDPSHSVRGELHSYKHASVLANFSFCSPSSGRPREKKDRAEAQVASIRFRRTHILHPGPCRETPFELL